MVTDIRIHPNGITGRAGSRLLRIGSRTFFQNETDAVPDPIGGKRNTPTSCIFLEVDGRPAATIHFGDTIRSTVPALVQSLKNNDKKLAIISGDGEHATRMVAQAVGIEAARGNLLPAAKAEYIDALAQSGQRPVMVGDGINDAAAMARAHLSVAVHNGQALAAEVAHLTLMRGDPAQLLAVFDLSRQINRKVVQNLWCAWVYNLIGIPVAMSGMLTPLLAATAMLFSSLTVIGNTLLLIKQNQ